MQIYMAYEKARAKEHELFLRLSQEHNITDYETPEIYTYLVDIVEWGHNRDYDYTLDELWEMIKTKKVL